MNSMYNQIADYKVCTLELDTVIPSRCTHCLIFLFVDSSNEACQSQLRTLSSENSRLREANARHCAKLSQLKVSSLTRHTYIQNSTYNRCVKRVAINASIIILFPSE